MFDVLSQPWWTYILVGCISGIFSATFGVGSGIILIPILVLAFALPQKSAQGICLAVMVPMALVGAMKYKLNPEVDMNMAIIVLLAIGAVAGALIGANLAAWMSALTLRRLFAIVMIAAAVRMLTTKPKQQAVAQGTTPVTAEQDTQEDFGP
jgi:uncharacterized membrane protein YfcA